MGGRFGDFIAVSGNSSAGVRSRPGHFHKTQRLQRAQRRLVLVACVFLTVFCGSLALMLVSEHRAVAVPTGAAAVHPADSDVLYFVSMNNGRHKFSSTLEEHNAAVHRYQILKEVGP